MGVPGLASLLSVNQARALVISWYQAENWWDRSAGRINGGISLRTDVHYFQIRCVYTATGLHRQACDRRILAQRESGLALRATDRLCRDRGNQPTQVQCELVYNDGT
jgi:hypothetical protein